MLHLLKVDLKKLFNYRTFWIICGLYFLTLGMATASGMEFLKWLANTFKDFGSKLNIDRIPLYHFPDVWQNLTWGSGLLKLMLAIMVIISITNEYQYRTIRQNIIDGMSREQFILSKVFTNLLLSISSMVLVFFVALFTGFIYSPEISFSYMFTGAEFCLSYFLELFAFLSFALMLGILIQRSGLSIVLLFSSYLIETIIKTNIDDYFPSIVPFFPLQSIMNLVPLPFAKYAFQEIQDYVSLTAVAIALGWTFLSTISPIYD